MVRINLLPPEIVQKRKAEKIFGYVALGGVGVAVAERHDLEPAS